MFRIERFWRGLITGGEWANALPSATRRNLHLFWYDGVLAAASETIPVTYLTLYLLALGATDAHVGWFNALSNLAAALFLLPGAWLVERVGRRKELTASLGGVAARLMFLALALLPLMGARGPTLIWAAIGLAVARAALGNLAFPAWMSLTADLVPIEGRGRYFGARNWAMGVATMLVTYAVGAGITGLGAPLGYQAALALACVLGFASTYFFANLRDPQPASAGRAAQALSLRAVWADMRASPAFLVLCAVAAVWNFSINISAPFFAVYMAHDLRFTAAMIGLTTVATSISKLLTQRKAGELADRFGPERIQLLSMFIIPVLPLMWLFVTNIWQVVGINLLGGVFWGAFELVSFNYLLGFLPPERQARYSAIYQVLVAVALAGGAVAGAAVIAQWGYKGIFIASAGGRIVAALGFGALVRALRRPSVPRPA